MSASSGLDPISLSDIAPFSGKQLPAAQRDAWLQTITAKGGESGRVDGGVTGSRVQRRPDRVLGVGIARRFDEARTRCVPGADVRQRRTHRHARRISSLKGSTVHVGAFTTAAASYGLGFGDEKSHFALGVTGKYVLGNALAIAQDQGTAATNAGRRR